MPSIYREKHIIDIFKGCTLPFVLIVIYWKFTVSPHHDFTALWLYAATHGSYGIFWCLKSALFGDKNWEKPLTPFRFVILFAGLLGYWGNPVLIAHFNVVNSPVYVGVCVFMYSVGVFYHFASDMQKYISLKLKPGVLIKDGLWWNTRNPNYFGEFLIYFSFAMQATHWSGFIVLFSAILYEWIPNMMRKDKSLSRYKEFEQYKKQSGLIFPYGFEPFIFVFAFIFYQIAKNSPPLL